MTSFLNRNLQGGQAAEIISQLQAGLDQLPQVLGNVLDMALDVDAITPGGFAGNFEPCQWF